MHYQHAARQGLQHSSSETALTEALILLSLGVPREAERCADKALKGFENLGLKTEQGSALTTLAHCARRRGRYEKALRLHSRARQLFEDGKIQEGSKQAALDEASCLFEAGNHAAANA